jgi:hypothetical protein
MATRQLRASDDPEYRQSRAALREIYGSRRIDGSAPQSARDTTPSGRAAYLNYGKTPGLSANDQTPSARESRALVTNDMGVQTPAQAAGLVADRFAAQFRPRLSQGDASPPMGRPSGWSKTQPMGLPDIIRGDIQSGAVTGSYPVPKYGGTVGFSMPQPTPTSFPLDTPSPVDASSLAPYLPTTPKPTGYVPPWRKQQPPGIMSTVLNGAAKWIV